MGKIKYRGQHFVKQVQFDLFVCTQLNVDQILFFYNIDNDSTTTHIVCVRVLVANAYIWYDAIGNSTKENHSRKRWKDAKNEEDWNRLWSRDYVLRELDYFLLVCNFKSLLAQFTILFWLPLRLDLNIFARHHPI